MEPTPLLHQDIVIVRLSEKERTTGSMTAENLGITVTAMHRDGVVVLENAVDTEHCDSLNGILVEEAETMARLPTTHFNENSVDGKPVGNMSQGPPLDPRLMYSDIWANGPAAQALENILGPSPRVNYVNGNTALGGYHDARQRVHADLSFNHGQLPFGVVANYYLTDVTPANGSTELWIASHRDTSFRDHRNCYLGEMADKTQSEKESVFGIRDERLEERRRYAPPIRPCVKKGSVVLRDLRLWHAGIANPSEKPRIMLAFVHTPSWYLCPSKVVLPLSCREIVEQWARRKHPIVYNAHFVPAELDHRKVKFNPNFSSANKGFMSLLPNLPRGFVFGEEPETEGFSS